MTRGAVGWWLFLLSARIFDWAARVAGPGELERRIADQAWLEERPVDYERRPW